MWLFDGGSILSELIGGYEDQTPMPVVRNWPMAQVIGDNIFAYGGKTTSGGGEGNTTNTTLKYDFNTKQWLFVRNGPVARVAGVTVEHEGKMHLFGGWIRGGVRFLGDHHIYDSTQDVWTTGPTGPNGRIIPSWIKIGNYAYLYGGYGYPPSGGSSTRLRDHWRYDLVNGTWLRLPDAPMARNAHATVPYKNGYLVIGGVGSEASTVPLVDVYYYDVPSNTWTKLPDFPIGINNGGAFEYAGGIYHFGGESGANFVNQINALYKLDPIAETWSVIANMEFTARRFAALKYRGEVYMLGGDINGEVTNRLIKLT